ncbi:DUF4126 domain-containing protein [Desulfobacter hydrogenophilus]|uniref:DUF4126 domain-containing protein n=1 Tax=Desulfobacter hydrogenophilus TaxID=2291 RepID=UPI002415BD75|nr:DUF4126 domain-containing protein [Desulfobacter hydrogenophilus]
MESFDQIIKTISLSMGAAWAAGINLYATVFILGILGATGNLVLPQNLEILSDPVVLWASGFMYFVEFFADKTPRGGYGVGCHSHLYPDSCRRDDCRRCCG